jgi:pimeloyl-ACP methyl ester carboxylesterase
MEKPKISGPLSAIAAHDGISLVFESRGQASPLLFFIHGWTCRRSYWQPQLDYFYPKYSVAALDLPGHGDSGSNNRVLWGVEPYTLDVVACVNALRAEKVILIGHSMGGADALEAARHLDSIVAGVVLVDTFAIDYGGLSTEAIQTFAAPFAEDFVAAMADLVKQTSTTATPPELKQLLIREMSAADPAWALPVWQDLLSWNPQAAFEKLQIPIHAINGDLIPESARERCLPFIAETLIPGAGHFLQMEDPAEFNLVLEKVLAKLH